MDREREGEKHQLVVFLMCLESEPETQECAFTGNQTGDLSLCTMMPNQINHTSQDEEVIF